MKRSFIGSMSVVAKMLLCSVLVMLSVVSAHGQATVTATGLGPGPTAYTSLRLAFNAINAGTHTGAITITIGAAGTNEGATPAVLNAPTAPASYTSVLIKPAASTTPTIQGNIANNAVIHLFGASNVTIDGSNTVGGTTKDLTIRNTTFTANSSVLRFGNNPTLGATGNTLKNINFLQSGTTIGIAVTSGNGSAALFAVASVANSNNTIQNCSFSQAQTAVYVFGNAAPAVDDNWVVTGNTMTNLGFTGAHLNNTSNAQITNNVIDNVTINGTTQAAGITLSFVGTNATISGNKISNISNTFAGASPAAEGIFLSVNAGGSVNVFNNFISNVTGVGNAVLNNNGHGILDNSGGTINCYHNSVNMSVSQTNATGTSAAFCASGTATGPINLKDNIFVNTQTVGGCYSVYSVIAAASFPGMDYNDYFATSGNLGFVGGVARTTIAAMQTGFGSNLNSVNINPVFVSSSDLHLQIVAPNFPLAAGTPIATPAITTDIDNVNRSATAPTIGAHELANKVTYTVKGNSCNNLLDTLSPVAVQSPGGVALAGPLMTRLYYRKGTGPWVSVAGTPLTGSTATISNWRCVFDYSLLGGVTAGDVIQYFVISQTTTGTTFGSPDAGLTAVDVNTITTPPTTPNSFTINAVTLNGLTLSNQVCFNPSVSTPVPYTYSGTTGAPNQYMLTWSPAGPVPQPTFTGLPASPIIANVPAALPAASFFGTLVIRNSTSGCATTYNLTLTVNPTPASIGGLFTVCAGTSTTLSSTSTGGTWTSGTPSVATIGIGTGVLNGVSGGTSNITYQLPTGCRTFANVTVVTPPGAITGPASACPNLTMSLSNATPGGTWSSSNPTVGTVDPSTGVVSGISPGTSVISYSISGCAPVLRVITVNPTPNAITGPLFLCEGKTDTLKTTSTGGTWISGTSTVASIGSSTGIYTGLSGGTSVITYRFTTTGCIRTNTLTIFPAAGPILGGPVVCQGQSVTLTNSITGGTWQSSLPGIILVGSTSGVATGLAAAGAVTITYTTPNGCTTTAPMYISTAPTTITGTNSVCSGHTITLSNGTPGGTWTSSNPLIATVGASTGIVTGVAGGTATISYATLACNAAVYTITVRQSPPPITGGITICDGSSTTTVFNASPGGVWTIVGPASISSTGFITGLTVGAVNVVTYTMPNGCDARAPIIVDTLPGPISGLSSICPGRTTTMSTSSVGGVWSSANSLIASAVAATGDVTGVSTGTTTITYTAISGCYRTKPFTVTNPVPLSVTLTRNPAMDTLCKGVPVTFTAHGVNGGAAPKYEWQNHGLSFDTATVYDSVFTYTPTHGDVIRVFLFNSLDICSAPTPAYVDMAINVYPNVSPAVNITTSAPTATIGGETYTTGNYLGHIITFNSLVTSGGIAPAYQWYVDGQAIAGATNNSFTRAVYDNDTVYCSVNGNPPCETGSIGTSNRIIIIGDYLEVNTPVDKINSLSLFPNPNSGNFTLSGTVNNANGTISYEVVNVLGQVIHKGTAVAKGGVIEHQVKLDKGIANGTYMLRVSGGNDQKVFHFVIGE